MVKKVQFCTYKCTCIVYVCLCPHVCLSPCVCVYHIIILCIQYLLPSCLWHQALLPLHLLPMVLFFPFSCCILVVYFFSIVSLLSSFAFFPSQSPCIALLPVCGSTPSWLDRCTSSSETALLHEPARYLAPGKP